MKTILVPTDFSATAKNAVLYAIEIAIALKAKKIILYNAYMSPPVINENVGMPVTAMPVIDIGTLAEISNISMKTFRKSIQSYIPAGIEVEEKTEFALIENDINDVCENTGAELIVLGITGAGKIEEVLIGSTALDVAKSTTVPVIIVPAEAKYTSLKNIVLACDFKKVAETIPVQPIKKILDETKAALHVVNVYESNEEVTSDKTRQQELLLSLFKEYNPHIHFQNNEDFIAGINEFVSANNIDMIIAIPKKHGFFQHLFKEGHAKKLAFHSHVPLMYIHEGDL